MSKRHTVTLHHIITVYNDMFDHMDGMMRALATKKTPWKEELFFAVGCAGTKVSKNCSKVTTTTGMLLILAHILHSFRKLRSFRKWDNGMDITPEDETSYSTQYHKAFLKYAENGYCTKPRGLPLTESENIPNNNLSFSALASRSGRSSYNPYDLFSDDEAYLMRNEGAEMTAGRSDCAARVLTAARLYLNSPPELPQYWGKIIRIKMITTPTKWRLVEHFGYRISPTDGGSKKNLTHTTPISPMWVATYSLSYLSVS